MKVSEASPTAEVPQTQQPEQFESPRLSEDLSEVTLSSRQQVRPEAAIMEIGLEALRDLTQLVTKPGAEEHQRFQRMANESGLTKGLEAAQAALSVGSTMVEARQIVAAEMALREFARTLNENQNQQYTSLALIGTLLRSVEAGLNDPHSVDLSSLSDFLAAMREVVTQDLLQIEARVDVRRANETEIVKIASTALQEVLKFRESVASLGVSSHRAFLSDIDVVSSITTASGRLKLALDSSDSRDIEGIRKALKCVEDTLGRHVNVSQSVRVVGEIVRQAHEALRIPENAKPDELRSELEAANKGVTTELAGVAARQSAEVTPASQTPLYGELFGSAEARQKLASRFDTIEEQLKKAGTDFPGSEEIRSRYLDAAAALREFVQAARYKDSDQTISALKEVICRAADLRKAGFTAPSLDEVVTASVAGMVAAQTGQTALVEKAERGLLDRLMGTSRRSSEKALVAAFGEDHALGQAAKLVSKYFDVNVLSREETVKVKLAELPEEMAKICLSEGMEGAKRFEASIQAWLDEGRRWGLEGELPRAAEIVVPALLGKNFLGPKEWNAQGIDVGTLPTLPSSITEALLNSDCPLHPGEKIKDTHILVLVPKTVNGKPYTALELDELCATRKGSGDKLIFDAIHWANTWKKCGWAQAPQAQSEWVLLPKSDPHPKKVSADKHFRGKNIAEQQEVHAQHYQEYREVKTVELMTAVLLYDLVSKERLVGDYLRCEEPTPSGGRVCVSRFYPNGLWVTDDFDAYGHGDVGRALARKLNT